MKKVAKESTPTKKSPISSQPKSPLTAPQCEDKTRIFVRVRPLLNTEETNSSLIFKDNHHIRMIKSDFESVKMRFDGIFSTTFLQKDIFSAFEPSIKGFLKGESHCFFAYGQTGAGKTYTMMGDFEEKETDYTKFLTSESRGILPRALNEILHYLQNKKCRLWAAFYEIYNDKIYDLLNVKSKQKKGGLDFRENSSGANVIIDLQQFEINSVNDMLDCLRVGIQNRVTGSTHGNQKSSRSHSIFQLKLVQADPQDASKTMISQLKIIDLAGSEKFIIPRDLTPEERELRITELTSINGSLSTLGLCVSALTEPNRSHIPLRNSKLTRVLSDTLNGSSKITFIVCISPSKESSNETLSTLQFASRAKKIVLEGRPTSKAVDAKKTNTATDHGLLQEMCDIDAPKKNVNLELEIQQLRQQNEDLKERLKRMERSCSPQKQIGGHYASQNGTARTPVRRSVSPYSSAKKELNSNRDNHTPTKKPETKARVINSHGKDLDIKNTVKNRNYDSKTSIPSSSRASKLTVETHHDAYSSKSPLKPKTYLNNDYLLEATPEEEVTPKQRIFHSADLRKGIKREELIRSNTYSKQRITPNPIEEISSPKTPQQLYKNLSPRQRTPDYRDQLSCGSNLHEWGVGQDSRCLKENEQLGLPEISAILPNQFNSCTSSETETLPVLGSQPVQTEPMKKIQEENNVKSQFFNNRSPFNTGNGLQRRAVTTVDDSVEGQGDEIIKEFHRKLSSVHQLNQQHKDMIKTLNSKLEEVNINKWKGEPRSASKSPNNKQLNKNDPKKMTQSTIKTTSNGNTVGYNSAKHRAPKSPELNQFCSVQGKSDTRPPSTISVSTTTTTSSFDRDSRKSENLFDSKSIMDIISRHWDAYKDNIK